MIDKVRMNKIIDIPPDAFEPSQWRRKTIPRNGRSNTIYYHNDRRVYYLYSVQSHRLTISGRLIALSEISDRVNNLDELYQGASGVKVKQHYDYADTGDRIITYTLENYSQSIENIIGYVNSRLKALLAINVDIAAFKVTYIEICFNVLTEHVSPYIQIFNRVSQQRQMKRYKNFTEEMKKPSDSSFYIKGKVQFDKKFATGYVVNFYNKELQLNNLLQESISKYYKRKNASIPFQLEDVLKAVDVLRLEVQCHYNMLSRISKEYQFDSQEKNSGTSSTLICAGIS